MKITSNWWRATHTLHCPHCKAEDLIAPSCPKPTLEHEQDGSYTCSMCGTNFRAPPPDPV
jgi:ribosomal protein L37AE/L43A